MQGQSCDNSAKKHYKFEDVKIILDRNQCNSCHYPGSTGNHWNYNTYDEMMINYSLCDMPVIAHGYPDRSLLIDKINGGPTTCGHAMPLDKSKVNAKDLLALEAWIQSGAPEFCISDYEQIKSILKVNKCNSCHNDSIEWSFETFESVFRKPSSSLCYEDEVIRYNAEESLLYRKVTGHKLCGSQMMVDGQPMQDIDVDKIRDWINAGAPESAKILPVIFSDFRLENLNEEKIIVHWETESEINTSHFEIEYSIDGIRFSKAGIEKASGKGSDYSYIFEKPEIGYNYFRIRVVDFDNSFYYSQVRVEKITNKDELLKISPNPILQGGHFTIEWYPVDGRENVVAKLIHINGQIEASFRIHTGQNNIYLNEIKTGVYYLSVTDYNAISILRKVLILDY